MGRLVSITEFLSTTSKYIEFDGEPIATGHYLQWKFTGASKYNQIDATETTETTGTVEFLNHYGNVEFSEQFTFGSPALNRGYDYINVKIDNTQGAPATFTGTITLS